MRRLHYFLPALIWFCSLTDKAAASQPPNCFPAIGFQMPNDVDPTLPMSSWWCDSDTEYAFMGFSYEVSYCQSLETLRSEFKDIRDRFNGRYVRLYGACDRDGFYNDIIDAAWYARVGVHALIWFGWDDAQANIWRTRRDALLGILQANPKAKYVTRVVQFGSEPLHDSALDPGELASEILKAKQNLANLNIPVTISELAYGYKVQLANEPDKTREVISAIDFFDVHMLPFFDPQASTARDSWPIVISELEWFYQNGPDKKIYLSQNGWPSTSYPGVEPNSANAVADVANERAYFELLDSQCSYFKTARNGGIGWFAHIYSDSQEPGYGIYGEDGNLKFPFQPRYSC